MLISKLGHRRIFIDYFLTNCNSLKTTEVRNIGEYVFIHIVQNRLLNYKKKNEEKKTRTKTKNVFSLKTNAIMDQAYILMLT